MARHTVHPRPRLSIGISTGKYHFSFSFVLEGFIFGSFQGIISEALYLIIAILSIQGWAKRDTII